MQTIPEQYKQAGHAMRLVRREGMVAMFKAVGADYWEVHKVRVRKAEHKFGKDYPEREVLAGNEDFGTYGWACVSQDRADGRFVDILAWKESASDTEAAETMDGGAQP